jgi:Tol biopolymer transport system component
MDRRIAEGAMAGDDEAFADLARASIRRLYTVAWLILEDDARASAATSAALSTAARRMAEVQERAAFETTLLRLVVVECLGGTGRTLLGRRHRDGLDRAALVLQAYVGLPPDAIERVLQEPPATLARRPADMRIATVRLLSSAPLREPPELLSTVLARASTTGVGPRRPPSVRWPSRFRGTRAGVRLTRALALLVVPSVSALLALSAALPRPALDAPPAVGNGLLAHVSGSQLVLSRSDGSGGRAITDRGAMSGEPIFSPLGGRLAYKLYATPDSRSRARLVVAGAAGGPAITVADWASGISPPSWSPDERTLVYSRDVDGLYLERMFLAPADGSSPPRRIGPDDDRSRMLAPTVSPDGGSIAFFRDRNRSFGVQVMAPGGGSLRDVLDDDRGWILVGEHGASGLAWSPTSDRILLSGGPSADDRDLYVIDVHGGSGVRRLTATPLAEAAASYSPNGDRIVFLRGSSRTFPDVVVAKADGSDARVISGDHRIAWFAPRWSPDGRLVAVTEASRANTVLLLDATGQAPARTIQAEPYLTTNDLAPGGADIVAWQRVAD